MDYRHDGGKKFTRGGNEVDEVRPKSDVSGRDQKKRRGRSEEKDKMPKGLTRHRTVESVSCMLIVAACAQRLKERKWECTARNVHDSASETIE